MTIEAKVVTMLGGSNKPLSEDTQNWPTHYYAVQVSMRVAASKLRVVMRLPTTDYNLLEAVCHDSPRAVMAMVAAGVDGVHILEEMAMRLIKHGEDPDLAYGIGGEEWQRFLEWGRRHIPGFPEGDLNGNVSIKDDGAVSTPEQEALDAALGVLSWVYSDQENPSLDGRLRGSTIEAVREVLRKHGRMEERDA